MPPTEELKLEIEQYHAARMQYVLNSQKLEKLTRQTKAVLTAGIASIVAAMAIVLTKIVF